MSRIEAQAVRFGLEIIKDGKILETKRESDQQVMMTAESGK